MSNNFNHKKESFRDSIPNIHEIFAPTTTNMVFQFNENELSKCFSSSCCCPTICDDINDVDLQLSAHTLTNFDATELPVYTRAIALYAEGYNDDSLYISPDAYSIFRTKIEGYLSLRTADTANARESWEKISTILNTCKRTLLSYDFETAVSIWRHDSLFRRVFGYVTEITILKANDTKCVKRCLETIGKIGVDKCYIVPQVVAKNGETFEGYYSILSTDGDEKTAELFFKEYYSR